MTGRPTLDTCSFPGCYRPRNTRGLCVAHNYQRKTWGELRPIKDVKYRFWSHVDKSGDCWEWTAGVTHNGYGRMKAHGRMYRAHRLSYEWEYGPIPDGVSVVHKCQTRKCVRPDHLYIKEPANEYH